MLFMNILGLSQIFQNILFLLQKSVIKFSDQFSNYYCHCCSIGKYNDIFQQRLSTEVLTTVSIDHFFVKVELLLGEEQSDLFTT